MTLPDLAQWKRMSPLLDELLELDDAARAARLSELRAEEPAIAERLHTLLTDEAAARRAQFLSGDATQPPLLVPLDSASLVGQPIGAYLLEAPLGHGGMGSVWRARRADGRFEGQVAVKLLHLSAIGRNAARRFEREGAILARLTLWPQILCLASAQTQTNDSSEKPPAG